MSFGSLMDIDRLIRRGDSYTETTGFGSLMDIDRLIQIVKFPLLSTVLVL